MSGYVFICMFVCDCVIFFVTYLHNIRVGSALVGLVVLSVFKEDLVHVCASILEQLVSAVEDD